MQNISIQESLQAALTDALTRLHSETGHSMPLPSVVRSTKRMHGDFSSNIAFKLSNTLGQTPAATAQRVIRMLPSCPLITRCESAGGGFINFFVDASKLRKPLWKILEESEEYGNTPPRDDSRVLVEFVSANPTGPLHIGHGRGAIYGDVLCRLLQAAGYTVDREYYINDAGRQMDILTLSTWLRYAELCGTKMECRTSKIYQGDYILAIAESVATKFHLKLYVDGQGQHFSLKTDTNAELDDESVLDSYIAQLRGHLEQAYSTLSQHIVDYMISDIRGSLERIGVNYDYWYSEKSLTEQGRIDQAITLLKKSGDTYKKDGALWFHSKKYGDSLDRVVVRTNGSCTYFTSDIAYHIHKFERGYRRIINIWGSDHHGYVKRLSAALEACGYASKSMDVILVQFVSLLDNQQKQSMSTRSGKFVELSQLLTVVGFDAVRLFYLTRKYSQHMEFDIGLANQRSNDNPVYYIQYAHARICSILQEAHKRDISWEGLSITDHLLQSPQEQKLLDLVDKYPQIVRQAAEHMEPHFVVCFLIKISAALHAYYNLTPILKQNDPAMRVARLALIKAVSVVLSCGLKLLGIKAAAKM